jgi:hypothetical protein
MLIGVADPQAVSRRAKSVFSVRCAASRIALLGSSPANRGIANFAVARRIFPVPPGFSPRAMTPCTGFSKYPFP